MSDALLKFPDTQAIITPRLGDDLLQRGLITHDQLEVALHEKNRSGKMLGLVMVDLGLVTHEQLNHILSTRSGHAVFDPQSTLIDPSLAVRLPHDVATHHQILPLAQSDEGTLLGMVDPYDVVAFDTAMRHLPQTILIPVLLTAHDFTALTDQAYRQSLDLPQLLRSLRTYDRAAAKNFDASDLARNIHHPVVRLINALLLDAVRQGHSDLHFEPEQNFVRIRARRDGLLQHTASIHNDFWSAISHRLKIMAGMNIANRLTPQDGRFTLSALSRAIDFRVASLPGLFGENITIRVLDGKRELIGLETLGFNEEQLHQLQAILSQPEGLIVVTGPTGSGKTTTLYAMLRQLADVSRNIMTLEDPIEYQVPMLRQTQVRAAVGLDFAEGVRAILRQDPDVILIGEIRDAETAQMAMRAAMTGHLVFTTLHTRDTYGVIPRLLDFGISPTLLSGNLNAIVAQRLARRLCPHCRVSYQADEATVRHLKIQPQSILYKAEGCPQCHGKGYSGRLAIAEIFQVQPGQHDHLFAPTSIRADWAAARQGGWTTLVDNARRKLLSGDIDVAEFDRVRQIAFDDA